MKHSILFTLLWFVTAPGARAQGALEMGEVARHAYNAGFRGGALSAAVAVADAESSLQPLAVSNNFEVRDTATGVYVLEANGKRRIVSTSNYTGTVLPAGHTQAFPGALTGTVVHHCRGLWQISDKWTSSDPAAEWSVTDTQAFDPAGAAEAAAIVSRCGRQWWKWISVMRGDAWEPGRMAKARLAAQKVDSTVLPSHSTAGLRVTTRWSFVPVRSTPGGVEIVRKTRAGDTGVLLGESVSAPVRDGEHVSWHIYQHVEWDSGVRGWIGEEFLALSPTTKAQPPSPVLAAEPPDGAVRVPVDGKLGWVRGANTASVNLRFGTAPALNLPGDLRLEQSLLSEWTPPVMDYYKDYYWRLDVVDGSGNVTKGQVWTFRTQPTAAAPVVLSDLTLSHSVFPGNHTITVSGVISSAASQRIVLSAEWKGFKDPASDAVLHLQGGLLHPFSRTFTVLPQDGAWGSAPLILVPWRDHNQNGVIEFGDERLCDPSDPAQVCAAGILSRPETAPPVISAFRATPSLATTAQPVVLHAEATDMLSGLREVSWYAGIDGAPETAVHTEPLDGSAWLPLEHYYYPPRAGAYLLRFSVTDMSGNTRFSGKLPVAVTDATPPEVFLTNPSQGATVGSPVEVIGTAVDNGTLASVRASFDGGPWQLLAGPAAFGESFPMPRGFHLLRVTATDSAGNTSRPVERMIYVTNPSLAADVFDETLAFISGGLPPYWQEETSPGNVQLSGSLTAEGAGSHAAVFRQKPVPSGYAGVETQFTVGRDGMLTWNDSSGVAWSVGISGGQLRCGSASAPLPPAAQWTVRTVWTAVGVRAAATAPPGPAVTLAMPGSTPAPASLRELRLRTESDGLPAWVDDFEIRGLRPENLLSATTFTPDIRASYLLRWPSWPGRHYRVEAATDPAGPWQQWPSLTATGVTMEQSVFPGWRIPRYFVRVRELTEP